ncbi:MAG: glycosyltransferase [Chitinophagaceae bacterium]|nr:MAG: glycosyltransferase [Chitinophagaceae bacterium]
MLAGKFLYHSICWQLQKNDPASVCCVTVTYGNRAHYVSNLVQHLFESGIEKIVVVDNGSDSASAEALLVLRDNNPDRVILEVVGFNSGSAKGFSLGIQSALQTSLDMIWILDDDNLPLPGALDCLFNYWNTLSDGQKMSTALSSYRKDRGNFTKVIGSGNPMDILPSANSFMGFNLAALKSRFTNKTVETNSDNAALSSKVIEVAASAYGGLWLHRSYCERVGLPDESYILYMDDFDFTYRYTLAGGKIYLLPGSEITDVENSYYNPEKKGILYHSLMEAKTEALCYYTCRNVIYFGRKYLKSSAFIYTINKLFFLLFITGIGVVRGRFKRLSTIYKSISDGENGRLGLNSAYPLQN